MSVEYKFPNLPIVTTAEEARDVAIAWQEWQSNKSMSIGALSQWHYYFEQLAKKYNLTDEFRENGII